MQHIKEQNIHIHKLKEIITLSHVANYGALQVGFAHFHCRTEYVELHYFGNNSNMCATQRRFSTFQGFWENVRGGKWWTIRPIMLGLDTAYWLNLFFVLVHVVYASVQLQVHMYIINICTLSAVLPACIIFILFMPYSHFISYFPLLRIGIR